MMVSCTGSWRALLLSRVLHNELARADHQHPGAQAEISPVQGERLAHAHARTDSRPSSVAKVAALNGERIVPVAASNAAMSAAENRYGGTRRGR